MRVLAPKTPELALDVKDWRMLKEMVSGVRRPVSQIAKRCRLSRQAVEYRLKLLRENKLLRGSRGAVNIGKLGYKSYHIFIEAHTPEEEKKLVLRAKKAKYVNAIIVYSGKYNLEISIMARDEEEFLDYYRQLMDKVRIRDDHVLVLLGVVCAEVLPKKYFPELKELGREVWGRGEIKRRKGEGERVDEIDKKLLWLLSRDALRTKVGLGKELGLSKDGVGYRIKRLEEEGYLLEYRPVVNYSVLGLSINSLLVKLNHDSDEVEEFESYLRGKGVVLWAAKTMGYYDYLVYVITKDLEEFHEVINGLKEKFDNIIKSYEVLFAFEELKYNFMAESMVRE